jgi:hypothetical protein
MPRSAMQLSSKQLCFEWNESCWHPRRTRASLAYRPAVRSTVSFTGTDLVDEDSTVPSWSCHCNSRVIVIHTFHLWMLWTSHSHPHFGLWLSDILVGTEDQPYEYLRHCFSWDAPHNRKIDQPRDRLHAWEIGERECVAWPFRTSQLLLQKMSICMQVLSPNGNIFKNLKKVLKINNQNFYIKWILSKNSHTIFLAHWKHVNHYQR